MIMALMAWFFLGGSTGSGAMLTSDDVAYMQKRVATVVNDKDAAKTATSILKSLGKDVRAFEKLFERSGKDLNKLYSEHAANQQAVLEILDRLNDDWEAGQRRALDARFALRDTLTEQEWAALRDRE